MSDYDPAKDAHDSYFAAIEAKRVRLEKMHVAALDDLYAQYVENAQWDEAKDVIEHLDVKRLVAAALRGAE